MFDQISPVESRKYLSGDAIEPKRVGEPIAIPAQSIRSSFVQYISFSSGITGSVCSDLLETLGTVLILVFSPVSSAPSAIACAKFLTEPEAE